MTNSPNRPPTGTLTLAECTMHAQLITDRVKDRQMRELALLDIEGINSTDRARIRVRIEQFSD